MTPYYADDRTTIWHGDCLHIMAQLEPNSVDAIVTDPPYGLEFMGKEWDSFKGANDWGRAGDTAPWKDRPKGGNDPFQGDRPRFRAGLPFQQWCTLWATEALRALKPGGHMLAFGGTRTWHRLACAIEDAGFEIRDSIAWLYGSGFPKSLDVSKAIDRQRKDNEDWQRVGAWLKQARLKKGLSAKALCAAIGAHGEVNHGGAVANWELGLSFPTWPQWEAMRAALSFSDEIDIEVWRLNGRKGQPGEAWHERPITGIHNAGLHTGNAGLTVGGDGKERRDIPATPDAQQWAGWGTALKPAFEPIVVARKPLTGTVASNVLAWGTGALNIDASRIGSDERTYGPSAAPGGNAVRLSGGDGRDAANARAYAEQSKQRPPATVAGRWPANVALDQHTAATLDEQSGELTSGSRQAGDHELMGYHGSDTRPMPAINGDSGGASRFFYTAKADAGERIFYYKLPCNCETIKPCLLQPRDTTESTSDDEPSWNTSTSGNNTTDAKSHPDTTSTTATETNSTTTSATSNSSLNSNTNASTPAANSETANGGNPAASATNSNPSPLSTGISVPKAGPSTDAAAPAILRGLSETSVCGSCGAPAERITHATVKPLDLMRWLVRLVTPPAGLILDPFAGSGTTAEAALLENFQCIAIEREQDYLPLITQRIHRRRNPIAYLTEGGHDLGLFANEEAP